MQTCPLGPRIDIHRGAIRVIRVRDVPSAEGRRANLPTEGAGRSHAEHGLRERRAEIGGGVACKLAWQG
eukprot:2032853-Pyramimonas_sp.AAC.1